MIWTVDYRGVVIANGERAPNGPWQNLGVACPTTGAAWNYLTFIRVTTGLDYYAAQVRPVRL